MNHKKDVFLSKPDWLKKRIPKSEKYLKNLKLIKSNSLNTVCSNANCPNIEECFEKNKATFIILGNNCTRNCRYCNISNEKPEKIDTDEPENISKAIKLLNLNYVVITSVTRDDLDDGGSNHFADIVNKIKADNADIKIELLIPDFRNNTESIELICNLGVEVINHNIETAKELFPVIRPMGNYETSINVLKKIKMSRPKQLTKSGLMIGLGETREQIIACIKDLNNANIDILTIGQYMQPSKKHYPVKKYYTPEEFEELRSIAEDIGIRHVFSAPLVRSSYGAEKIFNDIINKE